MPTSTSTIRRRAVGLLAVAPLCLLAGCGSSGGGKHTTGNTVPAHTASGSTSGAPSSSSSSTPGGGGPALSGGSFCSTAKAQQEANQQVAGSIASNPSALKQVEMRQYALLPVFVAQAPPAIKPQVVILAGASSALYTTLAKANFDFSKVPPSALASFDTPKVKSAEAAVNAYLTKDCGLKISDSPTG